VKRISETVGKPALSAVLSALKEGANILRMPELATAVRFSLQITADAAPGHTVELRVPPYSAVQVIEGGNHRRGTPPNVVEMDPKTWLLLITEALDWNTAKSAGLVTASGARADELAKVLPNLTKFGAL